MTPAAFDALAALCRLRDGPMRHGARLVLVDGIPANVAAATVQAHPGTVRNAVARVRRLARTVRDVAALLHE